MALANPSTTGRTHGAWAFFFIIVTVFIDMVGFGIIMPSMPQLMAELLNGKQAYLDAKSADAAGHSEALKTMLSDAAPWGGFITTTYAFMNFMASPVLGGLSDRFGRRPVLLASIGTLGIDYVVMGMSSTVWLLFLSRLLTGISGATQSTAAAYIADTTEPQNRGKAYGFLGVAFGLGFILGPAIGGYLSQFNPRWPFFASAGLAFVNFCYGAFVLPESLGREHRRKFDWKRANAFGTFRHLVKVPYLAWFILALGLFQFAHWVYPSTFNYFAGVQYGWGPAMVSVGLTVVGIGQAVVQGLLIGPAIKRFGPTRTAVFGFIVCIFTFAAYSLAPYGWMLFMIAPIGALGSVLNPAMQQIMSARTPKNAQGELQGAISSAQALANMISPLVMTQTFHYFTSPGAPAFFPGASFALAATICALSLIPLMQGLRSVPKIEQQPPDPKGEDVTPGPDPSPGASPETAPQTA
ncbi:MAG TPA: TCR/Tet family MFS transporter [Hyphomonadaceae bacterium]|nr:TCR/Tet family MFS transporter [Hyphomonadaceae bacterium]